MKHLIAIHGDATEIWRVTLGTTDSYGDPAEAWALAATETVWLQQVARLASSRSLGGVLASLAGRFDERDYLGFFDPATVVQQDDFLLKDGVKYDVLLVEPQKVIQSVSHVEAHCRRREEG